MSDAYRIACLRAPLFPLAARLRSEPELCQEAVAILQGKGAAARVVAATRRARRAGIRPPLTLTQARARLPKLIARTRDAECEQAAQEALLDVAESFSPRVEDGGEGLAYLDIQGLERHYPGETPEQDLGQALVRDSETRAGLPIGVGIAGSKLAASMAAGRAGSVNLIPTGSERDFLAPLPIARLGIRSGLLATLESWGIQSLGDFAGLPEGEVISRLGDEARELHSISRGHDPRPLAPRQPPPVFREGMELEWPLVQLEPFLFVARAALERLEHRMASQGLACTRLHLSLTLEPDGYHERAIQLPSPTREVKTLLTLLRLDLEAHPPEAPLVAFTLTAHPDCPREAQLNLFGPAALSPDRLATTLARLFALLGEERVGSPAPLDVHRPGAFALEPFSPPPPPEVAREPRSCRGLLTVRALRPAVALEVLVEEVASPIARALVGEGDRQEPGYDRRPPAATKPLAIRSQAVDEHARRPKIHGRVRIASGPWSVEEAWWCEVSQERDYWDVELSHGDLYRIYRDRQSGEWFADGLYD